MYASAQVNLLPDAPTRSLLITIQQVQEVSIDYSRCREEARNQSGYSDIPDKYTSSSFKGGSKCTTPVTYQWRGYKKSVPYGNNSVETFVCSLKFGISDDLKPPVLLYYRLTNFYQNHRRYVKSLNADQLKGNAVNNDSLGDCAPLNTEDETGKPYYPCGLIANSVFNDTFQNPLLLNPINTNKLNVTYNMTKEGVAWASDKALYGSTKYKYEDTAVPPNWALRFPDGYTTESPPPDLNDDEGFQVWMRTAGLPSFSKLALRNDNETMKCGTYQVDVYDSMFFEFAFDDRLTLVRFYGEHVRRYKISAHIYPDCDGRQESLPRHCICCRRRHLHPARNSLHSHASHQA